MPVRPFKLLMWFTASVLLRTAGGPPLPSVSSPGVLTPSAPPAAPARAATSPGVWQLCRGRGPPSTQKWSRTAVLSLWPPRQNPHERAACFLHSKTSVWFFISSVSFYFLLVSSVFITAYWRIFMTAASKSQITLSSGSRWCWHPLVVSSHSSWDFLLKCGHFGHCVMRLS